METSQRPEETPLDFAALWAEHFPRVRAYVFLYVSPQHDADDVIQETAMAAAKSFERFDRQRDFLSWVIGIARNRVREFYRAAGRPIIFSDAAIAKLEAAYTQAQNENDDRRSALEQCLAALSKRSRRMIESRYLHGLQPAAIGAEFGLSLNSVYARLSQIRSALRECVERRLSVKGAGS